MRSTQLKGTASQPLVTWYKGWQNMSVLAPPATGLRPAPLEVLMIHPCSPLGRGSCLRNCAHAYLQPRKTLRRLTFLYYRILDLLVEPFVCQRIKLSDWQVCLKMAVYTKDIEASGKVSMTLSAQIENGLLTSSCPRCLAPLRASLHLRSRFPRY